MGAKTTVRTFLLLFTAGFLVCGLLHVTLYDRDFTYYTSQFFCGIALLVWGTSIRNRVTDARLRRLLLAMVAALITMLTLQAVRYGLYGTDYTIRHWAWYADYLCSAALAISAYAMALSIHRAPDRPLRPLELLPCAILALLALGVLTNDLHHLVFRFPPDSLEIGRGDETHGPLFFAFYAMFGAMLFAAMAVMVRKWWRAPSGLAKLLPLVPLLLLAFFLTLNLLDVMPRIGGARIWNNGEIFVFCFMGFVECLIGVGMIPANRGYGELFRQSGVEAAILDAAGEPVYLSGGVAYPFAADEGTEVRESPIRGGSVAWTVDVGPIHELNAQLAEVVGQLEARNAYLAQENRIRSEQSALETRARIFDDISAMVGPQVSRISTLVEGADAGGASLAKAAVLGAYIKRRSNMELLAADGLLSADELAAALAETVEYLKLLGADAAANAFGGGLFPSRAVTSVYERVETCIEANLDGLRATLITLRAGGGGFDVRLMLGSEQLRIPEGVCTPDGDVPLRVTVAADDDPTEAIVTFAFGGGGAA